MINIVNKRTHLKTPLDFYCGRGSALGNPWTHLDSPTLAKYKCSSREESIELYEKYLKKEVENGNEEIVDALDKIKAMADKGDVNLVCYCFPLRCHCEIIKEIIDEKMG